MELSVTSFFGDQCGYLQIGVETGSFFRWKHFCIIDEDAEFLMDSENWYAQKYMVKL